MAYEHYKIESIEYNRESDTYEIYASDCSGSVWHFPSCELDMLTYHEREGICEISFGSIREHDDRSHVEEDN